MNQERTNANLPTLQGYNNQLVDENNQLKYYLDEKEKQAQYWRS